MPRYVFGSRSRAALETCHSTLQELARRSILRSPVDFSIIRGHRGQVDQDMAFRGGFSEKQWPDGNHNASPSRAFDFTPYPDPYDPRDLALLRYGVIAGVFFAVAATMSGTEIRWGQDWDRDGDLTDQKLNDMGHLELITRE